MLRGSRVEDNCPLVPREDAVTGLLGFCNETPVLTPNHSRWLKTLKNSARYCSLSFSVNLKSLKTETSKFVKPGPRSQLRPVFPRTPSAGRPNMSGSNHWRLAQS